MVDTAHDEGLRAALFDVLDGLDITVVRAPGESVLGLGPRDPVETWAAEPEQVEVERIGVVGHRQHRTSGTGEIR